MQAVTLRRLLVGLLLPHGGAEVSPPSKQRTGSRSRLTKIAELPV